MLTVSLEGRERRRQASLLEVILRGASGEREVDDAAREDLIMKALALGRAREGDDALLGIADEDVGIVSARDASAHEDEVELRVDADDGQVLGRGALAAQTSGHLLTGPDTTGVLSDGTEVC